MSEAGDAGGIPAGTGAVASAALPTAPQTGDPAVDAVLVALREQLAGVPAEDLPARRELFDAAHHQLRVLLDTPATAIAASPVVREPDEW